MTAVVPALVEAVRRDPIEIAARTEDDAAAAAPADVERVDRGARRTDERQARREAKLEARRKRAAAREAAAAARAEKAAADRVVLQQPEPEQPEPEQPETEQQPETSRPEKPKPKPEPEPEPELAAEPEPETEPVLTVEPDPAPEPLTEVLARHGAFDRPRAVPSPPVDATGDEPDHVPSRRRRSAPRRGAAKGKDDGVEDDGIVEAPREPKKSLGQRLRSARPTSTTADAPPTAAPVGGSGGGSGKDTTTQGRTRRLVVVLAGLIGAAGLVGSVVLAFGALLVALGSTDGSTFDTVSSACDALVGPLADAFSFSGTNAAMKESLVAWGAGAIIYLVVGMVAQSLLRSTVDD